MRVAWLGWFCVAWFGCGPPAAPSAGAASCTSGQSRACVCTDGSMAGTQTCGPSGELGICLGCPLSDIAPSDGMLCPELRGTAGCMGQSFRSEELPASILFLVDRSGSMRCNTPQDGQTNQECEAMADTKDPSRPTKWDITTDALKSVLARMVGTRASVGVSFFSTDDVCGVDSLPVVPIAPITAEQVTALSSALDTRVPGGGTPIVGGTTLAYAHLHEEASRDASGNCAVPPCGAPGNRFVVLITDGADSCPNEPTAGVCGGVACTDHLLDDTARRGLAVNIRTFVIGAPGSDPARGFLSELAFVGGTARNGGQCAHDRRAAAGDCHFDMTSTTDFAADLATALTAISGAAIGCEFPVPANNGVATRNVNVQLRSGGNEPECVAFTEGVCEGGAPGWQFGKQADGVTEDLSRVVLCGGACDRARNDPGIQVDVVLGCQPLLLE